MKRAAGTTTTNSDDSDEPPGKPEPYVVYWMDRDLQERLAAEQGCQPADVDPFDYTERRDFVTISAARRFARRVNGQIEQRVNLRYEGYPLYEWDWEQEPVE